jgi:phosphate-selective porin OprO and OprP
MLIKKWAIGGVALGALLSASGAAFATDASAIDARLKMLEAEIAKLRKEAHEAKAQAAAAASKATNVANLSHKADVHAPPPVFVSFKNGLYVETEDKAFSFKVGGRIQVDGGANSDPLNGFSNQTGFRRSRIEVEGKAYGYWFYKAQADFAGAANGTTLGV